MICSGCIHAPVHDHEGNVIKEKTCPFCRTLTPDFDDDKEIIKRLEKRMELNDAEAIYNIGCFYYEGRYGLPQNYAKALELWNRAVELGNAVAYYGIGSAYNDGRGVDADHEKARHYLELAAMGGDLNARNSLGVADKNVTH